MKVAGLYGLKPRFVRALKGIEDALVARRVHPDTLTYGAVAVSAVAGGCIAAGGAFEMPWLWLLVPPLGLIRLALNALDGSVARRTGTARPFGIALNEVGDRLSDAALIGSTAWVVSPAAALGGLVATLFASTTGLLSLGLRGERDSAGPMGKADRVLVLGTAAAIGAVTGNSTSFGIALVVIGIGTLVTAALRLTRLAREV